MATFAQTFSQHAVFQGMNYSPDDYSRYAPTSDGAPTPAHESGTQFAMFFPKKADGTAAIPSDFWGPGVTKWPVLFYIEHSGFSTSTATYAKAAGGTLAEAQGVRHQALLNGFAVADIQCPAPDVTTAAAFNGGTTYAAGDYASSGGVVYTSLQAGNLNHAPPNATWWAVAGGVTTGGGFVHAPGGTERRWESAAYQNPLKGAILAYQFISFYADYICSDATGTVSVMPVTKGLYGLDKRIIVPKGNSAGACLAAMLALRPSWAGSLGNGGIYNESTVPPAALIGLLSVQWFEMYQNAYVAADGQANPFPTQDSASGDSTSTNAILSATSLANIPVRYGRFFSAFPYFPNRGKACIPRIIYQGNTPAESHKKYGEPFQTNAISITNIHCITNGIALKLRFPELVTLKLGASAMVGIAIGNYAGGTTYAINDVVISAGIYYISLQNANTGNTPASSPTFWALYVPENATQDVQAAFYDGRLDDYNELLSSVYIGATRVGKTPGGQSNVPDGVFVHFLRDAALDVMGGRLKPWDKTAAGVRDGIQRPGRVEITGYTVVPADPGDGELKRKSVTITNCGCLIYQQSVEPYVGALTNDLIVSFTQYGPPIAIVKPGTTVEVPSGQQALWFKSSGASGSYTDFVAVENYA